RFDANDVWYSPVHTYDDLAADPQIAHCESFRDVEVRGRKVRLVNHPNRYDRKVPELRGFAVEIGEHTREIMTELGYGPEDIDSMQACGAVTGPRAETDQTGVVRC